jgi:hypothetical protein
MYVNSHDCVTGLFQNGNIKLPSALVNSSNLDPYSFTVLARVSFDLARVSFDLIKAATCCFNSNITFSFGTSKFYFCEVTDNIKTWVNQNISRDINRIHIQIMFGGDFVIPHVDEIRQKAYNYILTTGGSDVETCFYEPKDEFKHLKITAQTYFPKDRLNKTYGITIFPKKWHRLSVNKIHSVENLDPTQRRISLTLSLTDD